MNLHLRRRLPRSVNRFVDSARCRRNQQAIIEASMRHERVFIAPTPPTMCGGTLHMYYHYIFDVAFPLFLVLKYFRKESTLVMADFGPFSTFAADLFGNRIQIQNTEAAPPDTIRHPLVGMNPRCVDIRSGELDMFSRHVQDRYGIDRREPHRITLIERAPPTDGSGWGSHRRSITNHDELAEKICKITNPSYVFESRRLEELTFVEQVKLFSETTLVIAQHGGGLTNSLWMPSHSSVIELSHDSRRLNHFQELSRVRGNQHYLFDITGRHEHVDVDQFTRWIRTLPSVRALFHSEDV